MEGRALHQIRKSRERFARILKVNFFVYVKFKMLVVSAFVPVLCYPCFPAPRGHPCLYTVPLVVEGVAVWELKSVEILVNMREL